MDGLLFIIKTQGSTKAIRCIFLGYSSRQKGINVIVLLLVTLISLQMLPCSSLYLIFLLTNKIALQWMMMIGLS